MRVAGIDGTKGGWVAVVLDAGQFEADHILPIHTDFGDLADAAVIAIDVPIGFGPRSADVAARRYLTPGAPATVFPTPPRDLLERPFTPGLGVSRQSYALGPRVLHVTDLAAGDSRLREAHPEVSFRAMNDGRPLRYKKKTAGGALERLELLGRHGIVLRDVGPSATVPLDDVLDAAACAWSAHRVAMNVAESLPDPPERSGDRKVAIWY